MGKQRKPVSGVYTFGREEPGSAVTLEAWARLVSKEPAEKGRKLRSHILPMYHVSSLG